MGIIDRVTSAFQHPENWVEFECEECGANFRIDRADERECPECGSHDLMFMDSA